MVDGVMAVMVKSVPLHPESHNCKSLTCHSMSLALLGRYCILEDSEYTERAIAVSTPRI